MLLLHQRAWHAALRSVNSQFLARVLLTFGHLCIRCSDGGSCFSCCCHVCTTAHISLAAYCPDCVSCRQTDLGLQREFGRMKDSQHPDACTFRKWSLLFSRQAFATLLAKRQHRLQHPPKPRAPLQARNISGVRKPCASSSGAKAEPEWLVETKARKGVRRRGESNEGQGVVCGDAEGSVAVAHNEGL